MRILWYNMSWVVRYSLNVVCYLLNLVLWLVSKLGKTIGEFSKFAMDGGSPSDTPEGSVPMTVDAWFKGFTVIIAVLLILVVIHYDGISNKQFAVLQRRSWLPWPFFIRQSHIFYMHAGCVAVVAFTACRAGAVLQSAQTMPIVYVQVYAFDTLLLVAWFGVEVLWTVLYGAECLARRGHHKDRLFRCTVGHCVIQMATNDTYMIIVCKQVLQRMFMFDYTESEVTTNSIQTDISESTSMILGCIYPILRVSTEENQRIASEITEHDGFAFATMESRHEIEAKVRESEANMTRLREAENARLLAMRPIRLPAVVLPPLEVLVRAAPTVPLYEQVEALAKAHFVATIVIMHIVSFGAMAVVYRVVYPPTLSYAASAWQSGFAHMPVCVQAHVPREIPAMLEAFINW